jgi:uncharacterized protein (TIGR03545 family)
MTPRVKLFRWKAIGPLAVFLVLVGVLYWLLVDPLTRRGVEASGTALVGAKVDLAAADVRLRDGVVMLKGLAVTNPNSPMTNLLEADQIAVYVRMAPLLEKKLIIDTLAFRGLRFGTPRRTSGAVADPQGGAGEVGRAVQSWLAQLPIPEFSLAGLGRVVNLGAVSPESLTTLRQARALATLADSGRTAWLDRVNQLDPRPQIDSAMALAQRLQGQSVRSLGLAGARDAATSAQRTIAALAQLDNRLVALQHGIDSGVTRARDGLAALADARRADYAYAMGLLKLPSLDAPSLGPALFGRFAAQQLAPVLYWLGLAERYMPPGVKARLHQGPDRVRAAGTNVLFPKAEHLPTFLLHLAEASLAIGGTGAAAGDYAARVVDVTSAPDLIGRPTTFAAARTAGQVGPETVRVGGMLNHVGRTIRDSLSAFVGGVSLPTVTLAPLGVGLGLGRGTTDLLLRRVGDSLDARFTLSSSDLHWARLTGAAGAAEAAGAAGGAEGAGAAEGAAGAEGQRLSAAGVGQALQRSAEDVLWRTLTGLTDVRIDARLSGSVRHPRLAVGSNVARAVADGLRAQVGQELRETEASVRARVDSLVDQRVAQAQNAVSAFQTQALDRVAAERQRLDQAKRDLEARARALLRIPVPNDE